MKYTVSHLIKLMFSGLVVVIVFSPQHNCEKISKPSKPLVKLNCILTEVDFTVSKLPVKVGQYKTFLKIGLIVQFS